MHTRYEFPTEDEPLDRSWWAPLEAVARLVEGTDRPLGLDDFMVMARLHRCRGVDLTIYRHVITRRCLNLDDAGRGFRYCEVSGSAASSVVYLPHSDLSAAIDHLDLSGSCLASRRAR